MDIKSGTKKSGDEVKRKDIYTYQASCMLYSLAWCRNEQRDKRFRIAVGSFKEEYSNTVEIVQLKKDGDDDLGTFQKLTEFEHLYPTTKIMWAPPTLATNSSGSSQTDLIATSGDYLRLWNVGEDNKTEMRALLNNNRHAESCAPITSFDWNEVDPRCCLVSLTSPHVKASV
jgi:WD repeat-containing protein 68